jgi:hypothetical protein
MKLDDVFRIANNEFPEPLVAELHGEVVIWTGLGPADTDDGELRQLPAIENKRHLQTDWR